MKYALLLIPVCQTDACVNFFYKFTSSNQVNQKVFFSNVRTAHFLLLYFYTLWNANVLSCDKLFKNSLVTWHENIAKRLIHLRKNTIMPVSSLNLFSGLMLYYVLLLLMHGWNSAVLVWHFLMFSFTRWYLKKCRWCNAWTKPCITRSFPNMQGWDVHKTSLRHP